MKLGEQGKYDVYDKISPDLLVSIDRSIARVANGINPLVGFDVWNCYEFSTLDKNGIPIVGVLKIVYDANSPFMVESKSLKLYLNSWNLVENDLEGDDLDSFFIENKIQEDLIYITKDPNLQACLHLEESITAKPIIGEMFYTNLLRSNCPVTNQPDWADLYSNLDSWDNSILQEVLTYRTQNHFHEAATEKLFQYIIDTYMIDESEKRPLFVAALYTRRGGIDINPVRASSMELIIKHANNLITPQYLTKKSIRH